MAYDFSKERAEVLACVEKNDRGDHVQVRLITKPDKTTVVDVREFYTSKSDMETLLPTQRGLRLNDEVIVDCAVAILKGMSKAQVGDALARYAETLSLAKDPDAEDPVVSLMLALDESVRSNVLYVMAETLGDDDEDLDEDGDEDEPEDCGDESEAEHGD